MSLLTGAQAWRQEEFTRLKGLTIGLVANHTSVISNDLSTLDALRSFGRINVKALFAPEHGALGRLDEDVPDDRTAELPVYSLFGQTKKPTMQMLAGLDALVFELQDVGARFYTYASTLGLCLEACSEAGIPLIVLDRPNPITGLNAEGPIADADKLGFTAYHPIPIRHGLTLAELARLYALEKDLSEIVEWSPCIGWKRSMWFNETDLTWTAPSPAMKNLNTATIYTGTCLLNKPMCPSAGVH